jgi:Reverse transcriptase (RNA-dependent DNA polymerase).
MLRPGPMGDVASLRRKPRRETERPARASASGQLSSPPARGHTSRRRTAPSGHSAFCVWRTRSSNRRSCTFWKAIYEEDFLGFSYGFRPGRGQHDALDALHAGIYRKQVNWVLDGHPGLFRCHGPFMDDPFPRAPYRGQAHPAPDCEVAESRHHGRWARNTSERGTPQGAVISPILANVYLHYVFDLWTHRWRQTRPAT